MKRTTRFAQWLGLALLASSSSAETPARMARQLTADLNQMMEWLEGRFDNHIQTREDKAQKPARPHGRIHSIFAAIDMPELGEHVFYVQQHRNGQPAEIDNQRIYRFGINLQEKAIELVIYSPPDPDAIADAHLEPAKLRHLSEGDLASDPGCEIYWQRRGDHFVGHRQEEACRDKSRQALRLDAESIWIRDRTADHEGNTHPGGILYKLRKARLFTCRAMLPGADGKQEGSLPTLALHDQGDSTELSLGGGEQARVAIELAHTTYEGEDSVGMLELVIREIGNKEPIAAAWAEPQTRQIGVTLPDLRVGCSLKE